MVFTTVFDKDKDFEIEEIDTPNDFHLLPKPNQILFEKN